MTKPSLPLTKFLRVVLEEADPTPEEIKEKSKEELIEIDTKADYGMEFILDIHDVDRDLVNEENVKKFAADLCDEIEMKKGPLHSWGSNTDLDAYKNPKVDGISAIQFLYTSNITVHCIEELGKVFINVFSCRNFDIEKVKSFSSKVWGGKIVSEHNIVRK
jgi:S-adenosylmethionine decarboxylase